MYYITKNVLQKGIIVVLNGFEKENFGDTILIVNHAKGNGYDTYGANEYTADRKVAMRRANNAKARELARLRKQLAQVKALTFKVSA